MRMKRSTWWSISLLSGQSPCRLPVRDCDCGRLPSGQVGRVVHFLLPLLLCSLDIRQRRNSQGWVFWGRSRVMWQILRTQSQAISQNYQQDGNDASDAVSLPTLGADCAVVGVLSGCRFVCCCLCCMPLALAVAVAVATVTHVGHATLRKICLWCHKSIRIANDGDGEGDVTAPSAPGRDHASGGKQLVRRPTLLGLSWWGQLKRS